MKKLKLNDFFSGIGGFSYAGEKLVEGFETTQFIENDPYCQKVLKKHWPNVPIHDDITTYRAEPYSADIITGGFPCQDLSQAGRRKGITETTRSGLWFQLIRTIRMVRPKYFILENVSAILANGMDIVLRDIYEAGYDAEWCCIPSSFVGACHQRDRWWLIGFPSNSNSMQRLDVLRQESEQRQETQQGISDRNNRSGNVANSNNNGSFRSEESRSIEETDGRSEKREDILVKSKRSSKSKDSGNIQLSFTDTNSVRYRGGSSERCSIQERKLLQSQQRRGEVGSETERRSINNHRWRNTKHRLNPDWKRYVSKSVLRRGNDGLSNRVDRLKALGNSVVPQVAAIPLQRVKDLHEQLTTVDD